VNVSIETVFDKTDRPAIYPLSKKLNPLWWFGNDEAKSTDSFTYLYLRNPLANFRRFVIGVGDRDHFVSGVRPALTNVPSDVGVSGIRWSVIWLGFVPALPFVSWSILGQWDFYLGWLPWGEFGVRSTGPLAIYFNIAIGAALGALVAFKFW
jgi:hypothetical protein